MILVTEKFWPLVKHRNELKLGNLASGDKIAQKALNRFSLAVWGIRQRYPYPGSILSTR
ncbi:hypothetical protein [Nostoc sp.]|uniref:hypothetical protein n=1 Tax=Nostoc sp. TaxID=1180 RepID=UPI002FF4D5DB